MTQETNYSDETYVIADDVVVSAPQVGSLTGKDIIEFNDIVGAIDELSITTERELSLIHKAIVGQSQAKNFNQLSPAVRKEKVLLAANTVLLREVQKTERLNRKKNNKKTSEHKAAKYVLKNDDEKPVTSVKVNVANKNSHPLSINKLSSLSDSGDKSSSPVSIDKNEGVGSENNQLASNLKVNATPVQRVKEVGSSQTQAEKPNQYYTDNTGRVRNSSGRFASQDELHTMRGKKTSGNGAGLVKSGFAKVMKSHSLKRVMFGGIYDVFEEINEAKGLVQGALLERGVHDKKTAMEYLSNKKNALTRSESKNEKTDNTEDKNAGLFGKLQSLFSRKEVAKEEAAGVVSKQSEANQGVKELSRILDETKKNDDNEERRHVASLLKQDQLIEQIGDIPAGGAGGGSLIEDAIGDYLGGDGKKRKKRRGRNRRHRKRFNVNLPDTGDSNRNQNKRPTKTSRLKRLGGFGSSIAAGGGALSKVGSVAGGLGSLAGRAMPWVAAAMAVSDAVDGFTDKTKQEETFNLHKGQEATTGQKTAMALGSVLDFGGLLSGGAGLIGSGLEAIGFSGAKESLTFDETTLAKSIYDKSTNIGNNASDLFSSLFSGDLAGVGSSGLSLLKEAAPLGMISAYFADKTKSEPLNSPQSKELKSTTKPVSVSEEKQLKPAKSTSQQEIKPVHNYLPVNTGKAMIPYEQTSSNFNAEKPQAKKAPDSEKLLSDILNELQKQNKAKQVAQLSAPKQSAASKAIDIPTDFSDPYIASMAHDRD